MARRLCGMGPCGHFRGARMRQRSGQTDQPESRKLTSSSAGLGTGYSANRNRRAPAAHAEDRFSVLPLALDLGQRQLLAG